MKYWTLKFSLPIAFLSVYRFDRSDLTLFWDVSSLVFLLLCAFYAGFKIEKDFKYLEERLLKVREAGKNTSKE
jgi:hypothetical protein